MQKASAPWTPKTILATLFCDATMITGVDIAVWTVSAVLAVGIGWSRYEKWKTRDRLVRELAGMEAARWEKITATAQSETRHRNARAINGAFSDNELRQSGILLPARDVIGFWLSGAWLTDDHFRRD